MTPKTPSKSHVRLLPAAVRGTSRTLVPSLVLLGAVLVAPSAAAEVPEGWPIADEVSVMQYLTVLLFLPLAAIALVALFVYLPALIRGEKVTPGAPVEDQWIGGPHAEGADLEGQPAEETGGASARW